MSTNHSKVWLRRRGISLTEAAMALFVVGVSATLIAELLTITTRQQRGVDRRVVASQEAANVLDDLRRWPWDELTSEQAARLKLSPLADQALPGGMLSVAVVDEQQPRTARRLDVRVAWEGADGASEQAVELSGWRFAP